MIGKNKQFYFKRLSSFIRAINDIPYFQIFLVVQIRFFEEKEKSQRCKIEVKFKKQGYFLIFER